MDLDWCLTCEKALEASSSSNAYCSLACRMRADPLYASSRRPADYLEEEDEEENDEDEEDEDEEDDEEKVVLGKFQLLIDSDLDGYWWNDEAIIKWARQIPSSSSSSSLSPPCEPSTPLFGKSTRLAMAMPIASSSSQTTPHASASSNLVRFPPNLLTTRRTVAPALSLTPLLRITNNNGTTTTAHTLTNTPTPTPTPTSKPTPTPQQRCMRRVSSSSSASPSMSRSNSHSHSSTDESMVVTPGLTKKTLSGNNSVDAAGVHHHVSIFGSVYSHLRFLFQHQNEWTGGSSWEKEKQKEEADVYSRLGGSGSGEMGCCPPPPPPPARKALA